MGSENSGSGYGAITASKIEKKEAKLGIPPSYKVYLLNDDYTPMDFVVDLIVSFFNKDKEEAKRITSEIHIKGKGICGIYSKEIAETKVELVNDYARSNNYPLLCDMEKN